MSSWKSFIQGFSLDQFFSQLQSIHRPKGLWSWAVSAGMSGLGTAVQDPVVPLGGYGVQALHSTQERPANGRVAVGVFTPR
ncbi:MAG: hypothetical protein V2J65_26280 [Desulfobacteraceae bacterium]|nr:hypothetical protein [Desulfobacteraceae bacterium]